MTVKAVNKKSGETVTGKFAVLQGESVFLYSGCMPDKKGGLRGCGKKHTLARGDVTVSADNPTLEIKGS